MNSIPLTNIEAILKGLASVTDTQISQPTAMDPSPPTLYFRTSHDPDDFNSTEDFIRTVEALLLPLDYGIQQNDCEGCANEFMVIEVDHQKVKWDNYVASVSNPAWEAVVDAIGGGKNPEVGCIYGARDADDQPVIVVKLKAGCDATPFRVKALFAVSTELCDLLGEYVLSYRDEVTPEGFNICLTLKK